MTLEHPTSEEKTQKAEPVEATKDGQVGTPKTEASNPTEAPKAEEPKAEAQQPKAEAQQPKVDSTQKVETNAYVPTYKIKPEFKKAVLQAIGDRPFNEIAGLINAIDVPVMDHNTLTQIMNAIGQFPYVRVEVLMKSVGNFVTQVIED